MIEISDVEAGDIIRYTETGETSKEWWGMIGIVTEVDYKRHMMYLNVYKPWNNEHNIYHEYINFASDRRRFQKIQ